MASAANCARPQGGGDSIALNEAQGNQPAELRGIAAFDRTQRRMLQFSQSIPSGGAVAQLGARLDGIEEVEGSNPFGSTRSWFMAFHVYILQSEATGRYYVGQSEHLQERVAYHNANYSKALKNRGPWKLVHTEQYVTRSEAVRRERDIKRQKDRRFVEGLVRSASR